MISELLGWGIPGLYAAGLVASVKPLAEATLDANLERAEVERRVERERWPALSMSRYGEPPRAPEVLIPTISGRRVATWVGLAKALFWPLTLSVMILSRSVVSPTERQRRAEAESRRLRKMVEDAGLEFPEVDRG